MIAQQGLYHERDQDDIVCANQKYMRGEQLLLWMDDAIIIIGIQQEQQWNNGTMVKRGGNNTDNAIGKSLVLLGTTG